jgi:hypothetical protein
MDDYIKLDLQEVGWRNSYRIDLAQNRERWRGLVNAVMKPSGSIKWGDFLINCGTATFSRRTLLHGVSYLISYALSFIRL